MDETSTRADRGVAWSYSRLKSYSDCPRRYYGTMVSKEWVEPDTEQQKEGKRLHEAFAATIRDGKQLPAAYAVHQQWINKIQGIAGVTLVEQQWALDAEFRPVPWFHQRTWLRVIADVVKLDAPIGLTWDWKTGKKRNQRDELQLILTALVMFAHFPQLRVIGTSYIWLNEDEQTLQTVKRADISKHWQEILPRVREFEQAHKEQRFPATPNRYCKNYCNVRSCEFWGKGA
jgi:PD-(D/E)XK nuclease superfamily